MSITIELEPEHENQLLLMAAQQSALPEALVKQWVVAHLAPALLSNGLAGVYGKWPDPPSDTELREELAYLTRQKTVSLPPLK